MTLIVQVVILVRQTQAVTLEKFNKNSCRNNRNRICTASFPIFIVYGFPDTYALTDEKYITVETSTELTQAVASY